jgi:release factor glutamine methyltransferase
MIPLADQVAAILAQGSVQDPVYEAARILSVAATRAVPAGLEEAAIGMATARAAGMPLAYILGRETFMGIELIAASGALVPRKETELLGQTALEILRSSHLDQLRLIDMCCGSGNLACALARHLPNLLVWASDVTEECVALARRNVDYVGVGGRVNVVKGDLFEPLAGAALEEAIDAVVCNPPYISQSKLATDRAHLLEHEPREAFDGGPYGLSIYQRVVRDALFFLRPGGTLLFEIGLGQERQVKMLFERTKAYEEINLIANSSNEIRVLSGRKRVAAR